MRFSFARDTTSAEIDAAPADFPEESRPDGLVAAMVALDEALEHLKAIEKAGWRVPDAHPDLVPAAEAGRMAELLRLLDAESVAAARSVEPTRGAVVEAPTDEVRRWIARDLTAAVAIEAALPMPGVRAPARLV